MLDLQGGDVNGDADVDMELGDDPAPQLPPAEGAEAAEPQHQGNGISERHQRHEQQLSPPPDKQQQQQQGQEAAAAEPPARQRSSSDRIRQPEDPAAARDRHKQRDEGRERDREDRHRDRDRGDRGDRERVENRDRRHRDRDKQESRCVATADRHLQCSSFTSTQHVLGTRVAHL